MIRLLIVGLLLSGITPILAHPGVGIVMDSRGNIYYTNLKHVWKITPEGEKSIAVRNVHTHELAIDREDNLYGEHLWYEGERTDRWGHYIWKLGADGKLTTVISSRKGFRDDYDDVSFVRDKEGNQYWVDHEDHAVRRRAVDGTMTTVAVSQFRNVRWMTVTPGGVVFLVDLHDLVRVGPDGTVRTVTQGLAQHTQAFLFFTNEHAVMGLSAGDDEHVFLAVSADQTVRRVGPDGVRKEIHRSKAPWAPTGVCVAPNGDVLVLEYAGPSARVKRIDADGRVTVY